MFSPRRFAPLAVPLVSLCLPVAAPAQATGRFVIPGSRSGGGTQFSYWDRFVLPPGVSNSYLTDHFPNVLNLGDEDGNPSNWNTEVMLRQVLAPGAFLTGSGAIYSFSTVTGFEIPYAPSGATPPVVAGVVWQVATAGSAPLESSVRLEFTPAGGEKQSLIPEFHALDQPGTGGFSERTVRGYEWNLSGLEVTDYTIVWQSAESSLALYEAQLDTTTGDTFTRNLGWLLSTTARPVLRFGVAGQVLRNLPSGAETRFFVEGSEVPLESAASDGFQAVGWMLPDGSIMDSPEDFTVRFPMEENQDLTTSAIFSPVTWDVFRERFFNHANSLTETEDDFTDDAVSAPSADPDGDFLTNFGEYAFGGDPYLPDPQHTVPVPAAVSVNGIEFPALTYRRQAAAGDLVYLVEESRDLITWTSNSETASVTVTARDVLESDGTRLVTARSLTPPDGRPVFLRVRVLPASL